MINQVNANTDVPYGQDPLTQALSSCENLAKYLNIDNEVQALIANAEQTSPTPSSLIQNPCLFTCLRIESLYLENIFKIFNYSKPILNHYAPDFEKKMRVTIRHNLSRNHSVYFKQLFQENLLTRSMNAHHPESSDFYLHPNVGLRVSCINDDTQGSSLINANFLLLEGICGGIRDWFLCLYFKTLIEFRDKDPQTHLMSIAKLFENGASRQAEVLQLFEGTDSEMRGNILGFKIKEESFKDIKQLYLNTENKKQTNQYIEKLPFGVFSVHLSECYGGNGHALCYFKINENLGFLFDPNIGLIKLKETNQAEDLIKKLSILTKLINFDVDYAFCIFQPITPCNENANLERSYSICSGDYWNL
jgi:hypothetical protein